MPDRYGVIGNPVAHSKSPFIHAQFAAATGEDIAYGAIYAELDEFEAVVRRFREEGGRGLNVTVPFKHRAYALAQKHAARSEQAQAANTLKFDPDCIFGDNTDGVGLVRDIMQNAGCALAGSRILLMGAGGAAYGVCGALLDERPSVLDIANRTADKALALRDHLFRVRAGAGISALAYESLAGREYDFVINATSAGLSDAMPPLPRGVFASNALAYDMVYGKDTAFLQFARAEGASARDGLGMLVEQAAESFYVWRGVRPATAPVMSMLRAAQQ
jgi:shikimate dehydrogenase